MDFAMLSRLFYTDTVQRKSSGESNANVAYFDVYIRYCGSRIDIFHLVENVFCVSMRLLSEELKDCIPQDSS